MKENAKIKTLLSGLGFGESPRWHKGRLWFSNWVVQDVVAVDPDGRSEIIVSMPSFPFSIDWMPDGRLLIISGREQMLKRMESDGSVVTHADLSALGEFGYNEIVVDGRGNIYINGGGFGPGAPGVIVLIAPDGRRCMVRRCSQQTLCTCL
jgi:sugar lactone lactonase YvrE